MQGHSPPQQEKSGAARPRDEFCRALQLQEMIEDCLLALQRDSTHVAKLKHTNLLNHPTLRTEL